MRDAALISAVAGFILIGAAAAQDAPKPAGPVSILPAVDALNVDPPKAQEPAVDVGDLAAPGVDRIGLVGASVGGFPSNLWMGTSLDALKTVLSQLPRRVGSPAERSLEQNLLLSLGAPPATNAVTPLAASQWLLEARVTTLAALGRWSDVQALLELVPGDQMTAVLTRYRAEANLAANHIGAACTQAQAALNASPDPYWQKVQVFCQINAEQSSAASLGLALLREQKIDDPTFFWAADVLGGGQPPLPATVTRLEPLHFAMLRKAEATLPANIADVQAKITDAATLGWLAALEPAEVKAEKIPEAVKRERRRAFEEARILLAERAVAAGTLDAEGLRNIYRKVNTKDPAPPPLSQITAGEARGRAMLFQSAAAQIVPAARAEVIALALDLVRGDRGEKGPTFMVMGRVYAPLIADIDLVGDNIWFAGTAVRALLAAGDEKGAADRAKQWFDLARRMAPTSGDAKLAMDGLWAVQKLKASGDDPLTPDAVRTWSEAQPKSLPPQVLADRREMMLSLMSGMGENITPDQWLSLMGDAQPTARPVNSLLFGALGLAAKDQRVGETAALSLMALGEDGPLRAAAATLHLVVESLKKVGREADARAIAVEAALVLGL